jgi:phosphoserine phosphatase RsbU/P
MNLTKTPEIRSHLLDRRERLRQFMTDERQNVQLVKLLKEVESALERLDVGTYGVCEVCHEAVEEEYLKADPLIRICLTHLSEDQHRAIERDLELAARVQGKLLPTCNTRIDGWDLCYHYKPSGPVGGDYCDLIKPEREGDDWFFFLGDVSGKGVAASLLVSYLHGMFRSLLPSNEPLHLLVERANRLFCESTLSANFATLVCGRAKSSGEIELCNAGHCLPLVVQDGQIRSIESTGLPLGMFFSAQYQSRTIQLSSGDLLFLYTDGLTEARNPSDEEYSEARLSALVAREYQRSPEDLVRVSKEDLLRFRSDAPNGDDLTIMALQRAK